MIKKIFLLLFLATIPSVYSQKGFEFTKKKKIIIPFQLLNNLIIIPVELNSVKLNFILDTGVDQTVLFSLEETDSVKFGKVEKIKIKGLGDGKPVEAFLATKNHLQIADFIDVNHQIYIILDQNINFSTQIGIPIHGIIGNEFFKNHFVEINYQTKKIKIHKDFNHFSAKKLKKYEQIPISIELGKPYLDTKSRIDNDLLKTKLLIDTGGSDAIWLFENNKGIKAPNVYFDDFLGRGFSGDIFGKRARLKEFQINKFQFFNTTVSYPDSLSIKSSNLVNGRNGSIGGGLLKRFNIIFDYKNLKMYIKKNAQFNDAFNYDMSGLEIQHTGVEWIKEEISLKTTVSKNATEVYGEGLSNIRYNFALKPIYEITNIRKNSPAHEIGLKEGDKIIKINNNAGFNFKLQQIHDLLQTEEGKEIKFDILRKNQKLTFIFVLKKIL